MEILRKDRENKTPHTLVLVTPARQLDRRAAPMQTLKIVEGYIGARAIGARLPR